jgi:hypothetical protein
MVRKWMKPRLIVLQRNKPEVSVLGVCKWNQGIGAWGGFNLCLGGANYPPRYCLVNSTS